MDFNLLFDLRRHLTVAHHVPGRIRVKFGLSILGDKHAMDVMDGADTSRLPAGVKGYRLNRLGRSLVVEYDPAVIDHGKLQEALTTTDGDRFAELAAEFEALLSTAS